MVDFYKNKRVLVTGATGLVGSNLVKELVKRKAKVYGISLEESDYLTKKLEYYYCKDLTNFESCQEVIKGMDYIFHCAANSAGAKVMKENPLSLVNDNILMTMNMLKAASEEGVKKFLYISSTTVYHDVPYPVKEQDIYGDVFEGYVGVGNMKKIGEILCKIYHNLTPMKIAIVRPVNIFGPHDKFDEERAHVIPSLIRRAVNREDPFVVWGTGNAVRDFIYVEDLINALLLVLEKKCDCDPVNIGTGRKVTIKDVVNIIIKIIDYRPNIIFDEGKPDAIPYRMVNVDKIRRLGFNFKFSLEKGLKETIRWYKQYGN